MLFASASLFAQQVPLLDRAVFFDDPVVMRRNDLASVAPVNFVAVILGWIVGSCDHDGCRAL